MIEKGTNNLEVRNTNKKRIVNLLYHRNEMTKQDIAKALDLSLPTVSVRSPFVRQIRRRN
jgi:predicted transcriptional regulator